MNPGIDASEKPIDDLTAPLSAAQRRAMLEPVRDNDLTRADGTRIGPSERSERLLVHNMGRTCVHCTQWGDGLQRLSDHLRSRVAVARGWIEYV